MVSDVSKLSNQTLRNFLFQRNLKLFIDRVFANSRFNWPLVELKPNSRKLITTFSIVHKILIKIHFESRKCEEDKWEKCSAENKSAQTAK